MDTALTKNIGIANQEITLSKRPKKYYCPACRYELDFKPWNGHSASDEICPCCGIQYGYDDCAGGDINKRHAIYEEWRRGWVADGCKWFSSNPPPVGWSGEDQLRKFLNQY